MKKLISEFGRVLATSALGLGFFFFFFLGPHLFVYVSICLSARSGQKYFMVILRFF